MPTVLPALLACAALMAGDGQAAPAMAPPSACYMKDGAAGSELNFVPLAPGLWWLPANPGDADAANQGRVSNLLLAEQGQRIWLLGSGPTPAFGRALACRVHLQWGRPITDVISPWPHPELVLGVAGLGNVRHWAHADVAATMRQRCPRCVARLREQLLAPPAAASQPTARAIAAAADLNAQAVRVPQRHLHGSQGRLGPWRWWRLSRGPGAPVTVWQWRDTSLRVAHGLLWADGAPDARDADVQTLARSTHALGSLPGDRSAPAQWLGEQGPPSVGLQAQNQRYWAELLRDLQAAQSRGELETADPAAPAGLPANDPRHALNWQRAWRQLEAGSFQRSLR